MKELASATLLCVQSAPGQPYIVDGLVLPNAKRLMSRLASPALKSEEIELQWPQDMLDRLGEFFEKTQVRQSIGEYNCHTFGAQVTGQRRRLRLTATMDILNAEIGERVVPENSLNTVVYGIVKGSERKIVHTLVGTQDPGMSLSTGHMKSLRLFGIRAQEKGYGGELHTYTLVDV